MNILSEKGREVIFAVLPITAIVLLLHFTIAPLDETVFIRFLIGAVSVVIGLTVFLIGVDVGITPIGNLLGNALAKSDKLLIVSASGLVLGFLISVAEPDLHILAGQVAFVTNNVISKWTIVLIVSLGIASMLALGLVRIVYNISIRAMLTVLYGIILLLSIFSAPEFMAISFDASGATTGALTVPFILALALGVSRLKKNSLSSEEDSFGLVAIASTGAIISVLVMSLFSGTEGLTGVVSEATKGEEGIWSPFLFLLPVMAGEVLLALTPLLIVVLLFQQKNKSISSRELRRILFGMSYTFLGLVIFLLGVNAGFMDVGRIIGGDLAMLPQKWIVLGIAFILGMVTIVAEPAVYVLTHQIENVTSGYVKRKIVLGALSIGVALAVALAIAKIIVPALQLWYFLLPGYAIAIGLMYKVPNLFVGMAFDSGGVASGPMTATFILAYAQGVAAATEGANVLLDGFGIIAMVAMTPIVAVLILGLIFKSKTQKLI